MRVVSLHVYPVKGVRAVDLARARVEARGLAGDRRWLAVREDGLFTSQRSHPRLATLRVRTTARGIVLSAPGAADLEVEAPDGAARLAVDVWGDTVDAALAGADADAWLSAALGAPVRLVHLDDRAQRFKTGWTEAPQTTSFADGWPILVVTTGSLAALNAAIAADGGAAVPMRRFRPNIVVDCDDPWAEDFWGIIRIGEVLVDLVKPCARCIVTTLDQETGEKQGREPLASLNRLRLSADPRVDGVVFGWNARASRLGEIAVGDAVEVMEQRPAGVALVGR